MQLLVDVNGVGYEVEIPVSTFTRIEGMEEVTLHTHLVVREDAHLLFGFGTERERELFRLLIKVNRVGPRVALTILSGMEADALAQCIRSSDAKSLSKVPGVGKKTAEQIILDLQGKMPELVADEGSSPGVASGGNMADAESALIELGFKPQQAAMALGKVDDTEADVATLIRQALKVLG